MLIFSVFCLLRAAVPALPMDVVSEGRIYKTKPPFQIAGFGRSADEAGQYAYLLNKYQTSTSSDRIINLENPFGKFSILSYEFVTTGWMIRHKDVKGRSFLSYVVSTTNDWTEQQKTIDDILTSYMAGYNQAFPPMIPKQVEPTVYTQTQKEQAIGNFVRYCTEGTLSNHHELVRTINDLENEWLKAKWQSGKYLMAYRPSGTDGISELPRIVKATTGLSAVEQVRKFYEILQQSKVYTYKNNGAWGGNNCMFAAIKHHPKVIKEIVSFFGTTEKLNPEDLQFATETTTGGKTLRRIVCQWILDNMDYELFPGISSTGKEKGGMPRLTVLEVLQSIGLQQDSFDPKAYITALKDGTQFINEEISVIISVMIGRPIVVATEADKGILTSRLMDTILSRRIWEKEAIYIHNDSTASGSAGYSGRHYSGLVLVP